MKNKNYHQVTIQDIDFAKEIADNINNTYPGVAKVINGCCVITKKHYKWCTEYVLAHCKIRDTRC